MDSRNKLDGTDKHIVIYGNSNKEIHAEQGRCVAEMMWKR